MIWVRLLLLVAVVALGLSAPASPVQAMEAPATSAQGHAHGAEPPDCPETPGADAHHDHAFCQVLPMALVADAPLASLAVRTARLSTRPTHLVLTGVEVPSALRPPRAR